MKMRKYNILFLRDSFNIHGPGMHALNFAKELRNRGHNIIFCGAEGNLDGVLEKQEFKKITINGLGRKERNKRFFNNVKVLRKLLGEEQIEVVISFNAFSILNCIVANTIRREIIFIDCIVGEGKERYLQYIPCHYIAVSEYAYNRLLKFGISKSRMDIVYPSTINLEDYDQYKDNRISIRKEFGIKEEEILATSVAMFNSRNIDKSKGQIHIVNMLPKIFEGNEKIKFLFVGDGVMRKTVQKRVKELSIEDRVIFAGMRNDVPSIMFASDIFCHYPDQETFGMVITEAMSAYTPVVARAIGGIKEIVLNNKSGYLVDNLDLFAQKVVILSKDKKMRKDMGLVGRKVVEEKYTLEKVVDKLENVIRKCAMH